MRSILAAILDTSSVKNHGCWVSQKLDSHRLGLYHLWLLFTKSGTTRPIVATCFPTLALTLQSTNCCSVSWTQDGPSSALATTSSILQQDPCYCPLTSAQFSCCLFFLPNLHFANPTSPAEDIQLMRVCPRALMAFSAEHFPCPSHLFSPTPKPAPPPASCTKPTPFLLSPASGSFSESVLSLGSA